MAYELRQLQHVDLTSQEYAKYEMYDQNKGSFTLSTVTYELISAEDGTVVLSGSGTVSNSDTDSGGNTIQTIQCLLNFTNYCN